MKIFKYSFGNEAQNKWCKVILRKNFNPLCFQRQPYAFNPEIAQLQMWALIDENEEELEFDFICVGTGIEFDSKNAVYIGTAQDGSFVWHLFYKNKI